MARYLVGAIVALILDIAIVTTLITLGVQPLLARCVGLICGVTVTYFFNRKYTFPAAIGASVREWCKYAAMQSVGTAINFGVSSLALFLVPTGRFSPAIAICLGAVAGFCYNFFAARKVLGHQRNAE